MPQASVLPRSPLTGLVQTLPGSRDDAPGTGLHYLDEPQEWAAFSREMPHLTEGAACWQSSVVLEGMHCAACALAIEQALLRTPGVVSAQISGASHRGQVVWDAERVRPSVWMSALAGTGYRALPANDSFARDRRKAETRKALWRWLVAGLCMMQVMMYAYPAYIAQPGDLSAEMEHLLRWASWVLTLPVMFFSCGPFFRAATRDLLQGRISMDLPVTLGILITFLVSSIGTFEPQGILGGQVYFDSLTMFVFFLLTGRWLELRLRDRTAGALDALVNRLPDSVERQQPDGSYVRVSARRLACGDVVRVWAGESFPADGVVLEGSTLVDEALLTGESKPLHRGVGSGVLCGSHNRSAAVVVQVNQVGESTRFAQIARLMDLAAATKLGSARLADRLAGPFLLGVLLAAGGACAWWWGQGPSQALMVAVAVLVVTCPCALSLATPAALLAAAGALARRGVLVRHLKAFEALAKVDVVVFDKTGTLTSDAIALRQIGVRAGFSPDLALQMAAALAQQSLHPVARSLVAAANLALAEGKPAWQALTVTETIGQGLAGSVVQTGAEDLAVALRLGSAAFCGVDGVPGSGLVAHLADSEGWLATFSLEEDLRSDARATVATLERAGVAVHLLSGDSAAAVALLASRAGIARARGGCTPSEKLAVLQGLQQQGLRVAMVGDGLNDGPVLAGANVSFAFGTTVPLARANADFVVMGESLKVIADTLLLGRKTMAVVRQNLWWALSYNLVSVPLAIGGWMPAWLAGLGMAGSSLLVVLNAIRLARSSSIPESV